MNTLNIIFIDDEPYYTRPYRDGLKRGNFGVRYIESVTEAAETLVGLRRGDCDGLVLDLQMPRPENMTEAAAVQYVELTGLWLLGEYAKVIGDLGLPVAILTNVNPARFETALGNISLPKGQVKIFRKIESPARDFPDLLRSFMSRATAPQRS